MTAFVRTVVVNYNGGDLLSRCLESIARVDWPRDRLETVVVDNASSDGSADAVQQRHAEVRLIRSRRNLGFAGGNNLALRDLEGIDFVALLNNDAAVEYNWLRPLVGALEADPRLGAASPKILFAPRFAELSLETQDSVLGGWDRRTLGVRLSGVEVDGRDRWRDSQFPSGWYDAEHGPSGEGTFRWSEPRAELRVPWGDEAGSPSLRMRLSSDTDKTLTARSGGLERSFPVGRDPAWFEVPVEGPPADVVNNAGSLLLHGGYGADRGLLEVDRGQYDDPTEVFAWSGCSVLLRRRYLEDAGLFDPRFFLYYEDFDLAWRGRARGWRYAYVPDSVVRHFHTASTVEGSPLFAYYVERNRLLVHVKNAPGAYAAETVTEAVRLTARHLRRDVLRPLLHARSPRPDAVRRRLDALAGFLRLLPAALRERRRLRRVQRVPDRELMAWVGRR